MCMGVSIVIYVADAHYDGVTCAEETSYTSYFLRALHISTFRAYSGN